jgi:Fic/DOC family
MSLETPLIRLGPSAAAKEKRLASLLGGRSAGDPALAEAVEDASLLGSLELAGLPISWDDVRRSRRGEAMAPEIAALRRSLHVVPLERPFSTEALLAWHRAALGTEVGFRTGERQREGGPPASPAALVPGRLEIAQTWLGSESGLELKAAEAGALTLARLVEMLPFADGNGRVSRLAATHMMLKRGARRPILVGGDAARLKAALTAAFRLEMAPLVALLADASERAVDVMIQSLEGRG